MPGILPPQKPQRPVAWARQLLDENGCAGDVLAFLAVRGYFRDTMGMPGVNDRNLYDDALFIVSPYVYASFNANTDPSIARPGVASLRLGVWLYKKGKHKIASPKGYPAFVQAAPVTVHRDGGVTDTGWFGINIHRGGYHTTSSLGCLTIWPDQWAAMRALGYEEMDRVGVTTVPLLLVEAQG